MVLVCFCPAAVSKDLLTSDFEQHFRVISGRGEVQVVPQRVYAVCYVVSCVVCGMSTSFVAKRTAKLFQMKTRSPKMKPKLAPGTPLEASWRTLGDQGLSWGPFGALLAALGRLLGRSWRLLGPTWGRLGASWAALGTS